MLKTLLETQEVDCPVFLQEVNDNGLKKEDLVIGLSAKEREGTPAGRFFSLTSWKLRQYFVFTGLIIKDSFLPAFSGLTMADDQTSSTQKLIVTTLGQRCKNYEKVTIANNLDYPKWNNHQRGKYVNPVFSAMGKFLGYPNLITRTQEFFENSFIYYADRL